MRTYHEYRITLCTCYTVSQFSQPSKKDICIAIYEWRNRDLKDVNQFALPIQLLHGKTEISTQICPVFPPPQCAGFEFNVIALWTSNQINVFKSKKYLFLRSLHNFSRHPNLLSFFIHSCPSSSGSLYLIEWVTIYERPLLRWVFCRYNHNPDIHSNFFKGKRCDTFLSFNSPDQFFSCVIENYTVYT